MDRLPHFPTHEEGSMGLSFATHVRYCFEFQMSCFGNGPLSVFHDKRGQKVETFDLEIASYNLKFMHYLSFSLLEKYFVLFSKTPSILSTCNLTGEFS